MDKTKINALEFKEFLRQIKLEINEHLFKSEKINEDFYKKTAEFLLK